MFELVSEDAGEVAGHILFKPPVGRPARALCRAGAPGRAARTPAERARLGPGPRKPGETAREFGCHGVLVLGDPAYYGRFGFSAEAAGEVSAPYRGLAAFQALALEDHAFAGAMSVSYPDAFGAASL